MEVAGDPIGTVLTICSALQQIGWVGGAEEVPFLVKFLENDSILIRQMAAKALGDIGSEAGQALSELTRISMEDEVAQVRQAASEALQKIQGASQ